MNRHVVRLPYGLSLIWALAACHGGPPVTGEEAPATTRAAVIEGDDRMEAYQAPDAFTRKHALGTPALWLKNDLVDNGNGTTRLPTQPYTTKGERPLCPGTKFLGQQRGPSLSCTAFLVAPNLIATARHCLTNWGRQWHDFTVVFGHQYAGSTTPPPSSVPNGDVYTLVELVAQGQAQLADWAVLRLNRDVPASRPIFGVDPAGAPGIAQFVSLSTTMATLGYPDGLPLKYAADSRAQELDSEQFLTFLDIMSGSSGGPVFDRDTQMARGLISQQGAEDYELDPVAGCYFVPQYPKDPPLWNGTTAPYLAPVAELVRPPGARLEPTYKGATLTTYAPSAVRLDDGSEMVFITTEAGKVMMKTRLATGGFGGWSEVPGGMTLASPPAAVVGMNELWLFGRDPGGNLRYTIFSVTKQTWGGWGMMGTVRPLTDGPAAFSLTAPTSGGFTTRVVVLSIAHGPSDGSVWTATYTKSPQGAVTKTLARDWVRGPYGVQPSSGVINGFSEPIDGTAIALAVDASQSARCVQARLTSGTTPAAGVSAQVAWSTCTQALPTGVALLGAQGVQLPDGSEMVFGRRPDGHLMRVERNRGGSWGAWMNVGRRIYATPSLVQSQGTWWLYSLGADRRIAMW